jgi:hypothetical protein
MSKWNLLHLWVAALLRIGGDGLHTGLGGQVQMSLVKYPAVWGDIGWDFFGARWFAFLARRNWFGIRSCLSVVVLEAVHLF